MRAYLCNLVKRILLGRHSGGAPSRVRSSPHVKPMSVKASSRLALTLSRRRLAYATRQIHQALARSPSQPTAVSNDEYIHALYEDLMMPDSPATQTPRAGALSQTAPSNTVDTLLAEYARQGNTRDLELLLSSGVSLSFFQPFSYPDMLSYTERTPTGSARQSPHRQCFTPYSFRILLRSTFSNERTGSPTPV